MRVSEWAQAFNLLIEPAQAAPGETVYRLKDLFTTRNGSWDPSGLPGSVPAWARADYLKPMSDPAYNDDGGADHHIFGAVWADGRLQPWGSIKFWTYNDNKNHSIQIAKKHGWANVVMYSSSAYDPTRQRGPWAWAPSSMKADIVKGAGMPNWQHISFWAVWEVATDGVITAPMTIEQRLERLERHAGFL